MGSSESKKEGNDVVESTVCKVGDLKDGEMRSVDVGEGKVLLVREDGQYYAVGAKCTHYAAPLAKGSYCNGKVRCPWHGACFDVKTGDIEDFPGLDSLPKFEVVVSDDNVKVRASKKVLTNHKRLKLPCPSDEKDARTFLVIGGGAAGAECVEALRQEGFTGKIILVSKESALPYDRPKLSKSLDGKASSMLLRPADFYKQFQIDVQTGKEATAVDFPSKKVDFKDGSSIKYDKLLIATGGRPMTLDIPGSDLSGIYVLRTPEDGNAIVQQAKDKHVVVIGTSFIGLEAAAFLVSHAASVTVVGRAPFLLGRVLGEEVGKAVKKILDDKGVKFALGNAPEEFIGEDGHLKSVKVADGTEIPANVCVLGVGVKPATDFIANSGLEMSTTGRVKVDKRMQTSQADVYAAGDIVQFPLFLVDDELTTIEHWQMAHKHGQIAGRNMVGREEEIHSVPYFWTAIAGKSIRYAGYGKDHDDVVVHGEVEELKFIAYYTRGEKVIAVASMNSDPIVSQAADHFLSGQVLLKEHIRDDATAWTKQN